MIPTAIALLATLASAEPTPAPTSHSDSITHVDFSQVSKDPPVPETVPSTAPGRFQGRPDPTSQFLTSSIGGGLGLAGGALAGGFIGLSASSDEDGWSQIGNLIVGVLLGGMVGTSTGATIGAVMARPAHSSYSVGPAILGSIGGMVVGLATGITAMNVSGSESATMAWICLAGLPVAGSAAGATLGDQLAAPKARSLTATPSRQFLTISPWSPRPGLVGARVEIASRL